MKASVIFLAGCFLATGPARPAIALEAVPGQQVIPPAPWSSPRAPASQSSPGAPTGTQSGSGGVVEIPVVYLGCWQATLGEPDTWQQFAGPHYSNWIPATVVLCFRRFPDGGVQITFHKSAIDEAANKGRIFNIDSQAFATGSVGGHIAIEVFASRQQYLVQHGFFGTSQGPLMTTKAKTESVATIQPDGQSMLVEGRTTQSCSGPSWCTGDTYSISTFHAVFQRAQDPQ